MAKPRDGSVTEERCTCGYLERAADDPRSPIVYDARLNEYNFEYNDPYEGGADGAVNSLLRIYHCPFCGGAAPPSKRGLLFAVIQPEEKSRLEESLRGITTMNEALRVLGPPNEDNPQGVVETRGEGEGSPPTSESFRMLRYTGLSDTVDVVFVETRTGHVHLCLQGKYVGLKRNDAT